MENKLKQKSLEELETIQRKIKEKVKLVKFLKWIEEDIRIKNLRKELYELGK